MLEANIIKYMYLFGLLTCLLYHKITITLIPLWEIMWTYALVTVVECPLVCPYYKLVCECVSVTVLCPTLSNPMDCSLPGSSLHGIFQARVLEWGAIAISNCIPETNIKLYVNYTLIKK